MGLLMRFKVFWRVMSLVCGVSQISAMEIMPLEAIEPGMTGYWKTVVSGVEIETFQLKILGVADNFVGPKQSVIIAEALDADQIQMGPVSGMSGSPVYIEGKLIGAYAYGFPWAKEQAILGITPIENMLKILDEKRSDSKGALSPEKTGSRSTLQKHNELSWRLNHSAKTEWRWRNKPANTSIEQKSVASLRALPSPLFVSGVSAQTLALFDHQFQARGIKLMQAPMGHSEIESESALEPGSAVAGVLMDGDFSMARVGTVTWRDGDTLLAFGHRMDQAGEVAVPMAPAEIITIIKNVESSFKLPSVGQTVGTIYQDKLTGIAGKVGETAPVTPLRFTIKDPDKGEKTYSGNVFYDRTMTPLVAAISLYESLHSTMEFSANQTFYVTMKMKVKGHEDLVLTDVLSGHNGGLSLAEGFMSIYDILINNPFEEAEVESVDFDINVADEWRISSLKNIQILTGDVRAAGNYRIAIQIENFLKETTRKIIEIPIPENLAGESLQVFVGDAVSADAYDKGIFANTIDSLEGLLDFIRGSRSSQKVYVKLLKPSEGVRVKGKAMFDLPPSVRGLLKSERTGAALNNIKMKTAWQTSFELPGFFVGSDVISIHVK